MPAEAAAMPTIKAHEIGHVRARCGGVLAIGPARLP
jgi:hypothetical protein